MISRRSRKFIEAQKTRKRIRRSCKNKYIFNVRFRISVTCFCNRLQLLMNKIRLWVEWKSIQHHIWIPYSDIITKWRLLGFYQRKIFPREKKCISSCYSIWKILKKKTLVVFVFLLSLSLISSWEEEMRSFFDCMNVWEWVMIFLLLLFFILIVNKTRKCSHKLLAFKHIVLERTILFFFLFSFFISLPTSQYSLCACDIFISFPSQKFHFHLMLLLCDARVAKKKKEKKKTFYFPVCVIFPLNLTHISTLSACFALHTCSRWLTFFSCIWEFVVVHNVIKDNSTLSSLNCKNFPHIMLSHSFQYKINVKIFLFPAASLFPTY